MLSRCKHIVHSNQDFRAAYVSFEKRLPTENVKHSIFTKQRLFSKIDALSNVDDDNL